MAEERSNDELGSHDDGEDVHVEVSDTMGWNFVFLGDADQIISVLEAGVEAIPEIDHAEAHPIDGFGSVPASTASIAGLEKQTYDEIMSVESTECMICRQEFDVGEELTVMPCFHMFHHGCLNKWLDMSHFCPLCRYSLPIRNLPV